MARIDTRCCIAGGGPAGMMLGLLLGRAGVPTLVLEKHADFGGLPERYRFIAFMPQWEFPCSRSTFAKAASTSKRSTVSSNAVSGRPV